MKGSVRLRKNGKWKYYFDVGKVIDKNGNPKRKKISKSGFSTEQDCRKALEYALDEFENKGEVFKETNMSINDMPKAQWSFI